MRKAVIKKEDLILAAIHQVYVEGLENFTPKKVSVACRISEGSVYHYFPNKQILLQECMIYILKEADDSLREIDLSALAHRDKFFAIWNAYFRYFFEHKEHAYFHQIYRNSSLFQINSTNELADYYPFLNEQIAQFHLEEKIPVELFWSFAIDNILNYVLRVIEGNIKDTPENATLYFNLVVNGVKGLFPA